MIKKAIILFITLVMASCFCVVVMRKTAGMAMSMK